MQLSEHLQILGLDESHFAFLTKLPKAVVKRALAGEPIARPDAERIAHILSRRHGIAHGMHAQPLEPSDIDGLAVIEPHQLRKGKQPTS